LKNNLLRIWKGMTMAIKLSEAESIVQAAKAKALEMKLEVVISVVDPRGDLVTMSRMDGAPYRSIAISRGKAFASVEYGVPSGDLAARADKPVMRALMEFESGYFIPQQGAVPIKKGEKLLGAIGVSGASSQDDEIIALAGLEAL
jgi:glc operon protein GlcG